MDKAKQIEKETEVLLLELEKVKKENYKLMLELQALEQLKKK